LTRHDGGRRRFLDLVRSRQLARSILPSPSDSLSSNHHELNLNTHSFLFSFSSAQLLQILPRSSQAPFNSAPHFLPSSPPPPQPFTMAKDARQASRISSYASKWDANSAQDSSAHTENRLSEYKDVVNGKYTRREELGRLRRGDFELTFRWLCSFLLPRMYVYSYYIPRTSLEALLTSPYLFRLRWSY